ncbi:MAG TPA: zf-HC2 domain-containing protein [Thermoanaerobaculia bacterium]|nr:zf-HC2 domain-containing protein [Thermoanaerobaculia bacterium]
MSAPRHPIEPPLLSGFLDGVLAQGDRQRVAVHLETCAECRSTLEEMRMIRSLARSTPFRTLPDDQWSEGPRSSLSRVARNSGWSLLALWLFGTVVLLLIGPERIEDPWVGRLMIWGSVAGWLALLASVALDRWATSRTDIYRGVKK